MEIGQDVDKLHRLPLEDILQLVYPHAVIVEGHSDIAGAVDVPGLEGPQIGGGFGEDDIARVNKNPAHQIQGLLRPIGDENVVLLSHNTVFPHCAHQISFEG